mmetsp:Transcript_18749/g.24757  ORF Transcript_18749/g.24757 Transcript_18749/m.24757 type:complete len:637 (-) Transcript_18749:130-2040(-)
MNTAMDLEGDIESKGPEPKQSRARSAYKDDFEASGLLLAGAGEEYDEENSMPENLMNVDLLDDISKAVVFAQYGSAKDLFELYETNKLLISQKDKEGCTILQWAAINNRLKIATFLLDKGINVNEPGGMMNENALGWATRQGHLDMVRLLISYGADGTHLNVHGQDAIFLAVQNQKPEVALYLIALGLPPDTPDKRGYTALMWVCHYSSRNLDLLRILLAMGSRNSINHQEPRFGNSALHLAVMTSIRMSGMDALLQAGANCHLENKAGQTPLTMADADGNPFPSQKYLTELSKTPAKENIPFFRGFFMGWYQLLSLYLCIHGFGWMWGIILFTGFLWLQGKYCVRITMHPENLWAIGVNAALIICIFSSCLFYVSPEIPWHRTVVLTFLVFGITYHLYKAFSIDPGSPSDASFSEKSLLVRQLAMEGRLKMNKICPTCILEKANGLHHCAICNKCIERFDHHCPWVGNCVGRRNHRNFIGFLVFTSAALAYYVITALFQIKHWCSIKDEGLFELLRCLVSRIERPFTISYFLGVLVLCWTGGLLITQVWGVGLGVTTYDTIKQTAHYNTRAAVMCSDWSRILSDIRLFLRNIYDFATGAHEKDALHSEKKADETPFLQEGGFNNDENKDNIMKIV